MWIKQVQTLSYSEKAGMYLCIAMDTQPASKRMVCVVSGNMAIDETTDSSVGGHFLETLSQNAIRYESLLYLEDAREKQGNPISFGARTVEDFGDNCFNGRGINLQEVIDKSIFRITKICRSTGNCCEGNLNFSHRHLSTVQY